MKRVLTADRENRKKQVQTTLKLEKEVNGDVCGNLQHKIIHQYLGRNKHHIIIVHILMDLGATSSCCNQS